MEKPSHPWWETLVMIVSFILLWVWLLGRLSARLPLGVPAGTTWTVIQLLSVAALVWVFLRRMARVRRAMKEVESTFGFTSPSRNKRK